MKAPVKLYLRKRNKLPLEVVRDEWYETDPQSMYGSVEYTRKDVLLENACSAYCKVCKMPNCRRTECEWLSDFKEQLKTV